MARQPDQKAASEINSGRRFVIACVILIAPSYGLSFLYTAEEWRSGLAVLAGSFPLLFLLYRYTRSKWSTFWQENPTVQAFFMLWAAALLAATMILFCLLSVNYIFGIRNGPVEARLVSIDRTEGEIEIRTSPGQGITRFQFQPNYSACDCPTGLKQVPIYVGPLGLKFFNKEGIEVALECGTTKNPNKSIQPTCEDARG